MGKARVVKQTKFDGISLLDNGKYQIVVRPWGLQGPKKQATKNTLADAKIERDRLKALGAKKPEDTREDKRTLKQLLELWYSLYGQTLEDGSARKSKIENIIDAIGNMQATKLTATMFGQYREKRLEDVKARTVNRDHGYLRAMFNTLTEFEQWPHPNPVQNIKQLKEQDVELTYLDKEQRKSLLKASNYSRNRHLKIVIMTCLATGARWEEVAGLKPNQIKANRIQFLKTKNGKRRLLPIPPDLFNVLKDHDKDSGAKMFRLSIESFKNALKRADIKLPKGQLTHVLRHSFAVTFMEEGGAIHTLQKILGHSTITTTAIYLAFAPKNFDRMLELNPLVIDGIDIKGKSDN